MWHIWYVVKSQEEEDQTRQKDQIIKELYKQ